MNWKRFLISLLIFPLLISGEENYESIVSKDNQISDFDAKWALARINSHRKKTYKDALLEYQELYKDNPDKIELAIELGHLLTKMKKPKEALKIFYSTLQKHPHNAEVLIATAQTETAVGHAKAANALFNKAIVIKKNERVLESFANSMMMWGDFYKAENIYRSLIETHYQKLKKDDVDLHLNLAWALTSQGRFEEAECIYNHYRTDKKAIKALINLKIQEKKFDQAYELLLGFSNDPEMLIQIAYVLYMQYEYLESIRVLEGIDNPDFYSQKYLGIGKAYLKLGVRELAKNAFEIAFRDDPENVTAFFYYSYECLLEDGFFEELLNRYHEVSDLSILANLYLENGFLDRAYFLYQKIIELDSEYFPGQIAYAEVLSLFYYYCEAIEVYERLLDDFPENSKLMIAIARLLSWSKNYLESTIYYDEIIAINPNDPILFKEKARVALWGKQFCLAMASYNFLLTSSFNEILQNSIYLEKRAKTLVWNKRYIASLKAYKDLLSSSPGNEEALFDYAQSYCVLGLCDNANKIYGDILNIDLNHNLAKIALFRNRQNEHLALLNNFSYWREVGSGSFSQSQIARYRLDTGVEYPLSCSSHIRLFQQEYVENPFYNFKFYPAQGQTIEADYQINPHYKAIVSATYKDYFNKFRSTFSSHNALYFNYDCLQGSLGLNKEDEIYNYFSLKQSIQSINTWLTLSSNITRYFNQSLTYHYYHYNDHNFQNWINVKSEYQLTEDPKVFKLIFQGNYRNAAHQSITIFSGLQPIDIIHPYWTPDKYFSWSITLQHRHDYRYFVFCEAPERYIDIKLTAETDNVNNPGFQAIFEWKHEFFCHWGVDIKALLHRSKEWNAEGIWSTVYYRF